MIKVDVDASQSTLYTVVIINLKTNKKFHDVIRDLLLCILCDGWKDYEDVKFQVVSAIGLSFLPQAAVSAAFLILLFIYVLRLSK